MTGGGVLKISNMDTGDVSQNSLKSTYDIRDKS